MPEVATFDEIRDEFERRVRKIIWCTVATMDTAGRPRTRLLHPVWDGPVGYICTNRDSLKAKHLAGNPNVSMTYWDPDHQLVYVEGVADWRDDPTDKAARWDFIKSAGDDPYGYDPAIVWSGPDDPNFGLLRVTAHRIELTQMPRGDQWWTWRA